MSWIIILPTLTPRCYTQAQSSATNTGIPAWMPESSHRDVNLWPVIKPKSSRRGIERLPSLALDSGIHGGMTGLEALVYNDARSPRA
jgi:hypothetical protein